LVLLALCRLGLRFRRGFFLWRFAGPLDHQVGHAARFRPADDLRRSPGVAPAAAVAHRGTAPMTYIWPLAMCAALVAGVFSGYPVAFILAGIGVLFAFLADVPVLFLSTGVARTFSGILSNWLLIAVPLFVFMGLVLEKSGIAQRLLRSLASALGPLPGGYAFAVTIIGIVMAASTGII